MAVAAPFCAGVRPYRLKRSADHPEDLHEPVFVARTALPPRFSLVDEMPAALDQGALGSCGATAASGCLRYLLKKAGLPDVQPSRLYMYWNTRVNVEQSAPTEDTGVTLRGLCVAIKRYLTCDESFWPYAINKFSTGPPLAAYKAAKTPPRQVRFARVPRDLAALKRALVTGGPVLMGIMVYESIESDKTIRSGVVPLPDIRTERMLGGHAVTLCGYDDAKKMFVMQNTWGVDVGNRGFFQIPYDYVLDSELGLDFWQLAF
jgi:C1A family cysteine protease